MDNSWTFKWQCVNSVARTLQPHMLMTEPIASRSHFSIQFDEEKEKFQAMDGNLGNLGNLGYQLGGFGSLATWVLTQSLAQFEGVFWPSTCWQVTLGSAWIGYKDPETFQESLATVLSLSIGCASRVADELLFVVVSKLNPQSMKIIWLIILPPATAINKKAPFPHCRTPKRKAAGHGYWVEVGYIQATRRWKTGETHGKPRDSSSLPGINCLGEQLSKLSTFISCYEWGYAQIRLKQLRLAIKGLRRQLDDSLRIWEYSPNAQPTSLETNHS